MIRSMMKYAMCSSPNVGNDTNNLNYTRVPIMSVAQRNLQLIDVQQSYNVTMVIIRYVCTHTWVSHV
jgi:hypothetical protein